MSKGTSSSGVVGRRREERNWSRQALAAMRNSHARKLPPRNRQAGDVWAFGTAVVRAVFGALPHQVLFRQTWTGTARFCRAHAGGRPWRVLLGDLRQSGGNLAWDTVSALDGHGDLRLVLEATMAVDLNERQTAAAVCNLAWLNAEADVAFDNNYLDASNSDVAGSCPICGAM